MAEGVRLKIGVRVDGAEKATKQLEKVSEVTNGITGKVKKATGGNGGSNITKQVVAGMLGIRSLMAFVRNIAQRNDNIVASVNNLFNVIANVLKPVLDIIAGIINIIANWLAKIFGVSNKTSKSSGATAKSLASFDQLNNLKSSSGGSSSSVNLTSAMDKAKKFIDDLVNLIIVACGAILTGIGAIVADFFGIVGSFFVALIASIGSFFKELFSSGSITKAFKSALSTFTTKYTELFSTFEKKVVTPMINTFKTLWNNYLRAPLQSVMNGVKAIVNGVITAINWVIDKINALYIFGTVGKVKTWGGITLPAYANGGYVPSGQMFVARESGAELVGSIGNRTAVANNDQIIEGIKRGVMEAMASSSNRVCVYLDGKQITSSVVENIRLQQRLMGGSVI